MHRGTTGACAKGGVLVLAVVRVEVVEVVVVVHGPLLLNTSSLPSLQSARPETQFIFNERTKERTNERTNERTKERKNERSEV